MGIKDIVYTIKRIDPMSCWDTIVGFAKTRQEALDYIADNRKYGEKWAIETSLIGTGLFSQDIV